MRYRRIVLVSAWLVFGVAAAQADETTTPATSTSAAAPLPPAPANPLHRQLDTSRRETVSRSPFRFVDPDEGSVLNQSPPRPSDRAAVLGTERAWVGGRPPLDCAAMPRDAECH